MIPDRHYRLFETRWKRVAIQVYVREGESPVSVLTRAASEFGITLDGRYRVDRMFSEDGRLFWRHGAVFTISEV